MGELAKAANAYFDMLSEQRGNIPTTPELNGGAGTNEYDESTGRFNRQPLNPKMYQQIREADQQAQQQAQQSQQSQQPQQQNDAVKIPKARINPKTVAGIESVTKSFNGFDVSKDPAGNDLYWMNHKEGDLTRSQMNNLLKVGLLRIKLNAAGSLWLQFSPKAVLPSEEEQAQLDQEKEAKLTPPSV